MELDFDPIEIDKIAKEKNGDINQIINTLLNSL